MTCLGIHAVGITCLVAVDAEKVFLCFANSVASTRFMLQDEFNIQTTKCDNCIIQLSCIFSIIALLVGSEDIEEASQLLNCLSDMVYCTVCPCIDTAHDWNG
ncbi:uncharacterized protein LOC111386256 isoform X2 [Olea europaea var. sylvestris]|uniref:uncharacterized protein LOC111386256 isoform X2 n=1 Tax=Olea europaea var. sylvestris TaxID=158386 RepID=UPI000C1D1D25|nr:uncharacterized protein LOC111386256 isoform X2 [Olea europaea var. sylvestris]